MSQLAVNLLYPIVANTNQFTALTSGSLETGSEFGGEGAAGSQYVGTSYLRRIKPQLQFETLAVAQALGICGLAGLDIGAITGGLIVPIASAEDGALYKSGSVHTTQTLNSGLLVPGRISVDERSDAKINYTGHITYDGTHAPIVPSNTAALPSTTINAELFGLGPVTIGGIAIPGKKSIEIDFGIQVNSESADGEVYDSICWISIVNPKITIRGINVALLGDSAIPLAGLACTHANTKLYLRKRLAGGTYVDNEDEEHIKVTAAGVAAITTVMSANGMGAAEQALVLQTYHDGTNLPLVIDPASAVT